jgi:hypothetical protein
MSRLTVHRLNQVRFSRYVTLELFERVLVRDALLNTWSLKYSSILKPHGLHSIANYPTYNWIYLRDPSVCSAPHGIGQRITQNSRTQTGNGQPLQKQRAIL